MQSETAKSARYYARRGLKVFPVEAGGKAPVGALVPHGVLDATTDETVIARWFDAGSYNIGVAMAPGVVVVDVDPRNGGTETLAAWCALHGDEWLDGPHAATGGGGLHYWFRYDARELVKALGGVDLVRGNKYVVAPPSVTAGPYRWIVALPHDLADLPELPAWLLELTTPAPIATPEREPRAGDDRPGDRWAKATTWADLLTPDGWSLEGRIGAEDRWTRPGKSTREGMSATTGHSEADTLHVFTSSVPALEADANYSKLGYLAAMRFGGDHGAAARWLVAEGYGDPVVEHAELASLVAPVAVDRPAPAGNPDDPGDNLSLEVAREVRRLRVRDEAARQHASAMAEREIPAHVSAATLLAQPEEPIPWRVDGLLTQGDNVLLAAERKSGKTTFSLNLVASLVERTPFMGRATTPLEGTISYWDAELGARRFRQWLRALDIDGELDTVEYLDLRATPFPSIHDDNVAADVVERLRAQRCEVWIIDPAVHAIAGWPTRSPNAESDNIAVTQFTGRLDEIKTAAGVSELVVVHHAGKDGTTRGRGASRWEDWPDVLWYLRRTRTESRFMALGRDVDADWQDLGYNPTTHRLTVVAADAAAMADEVVAALAGAGGRVEGVPEMRDLVGGGNEVAEAKIGNTLALGRIVRDGKGRRGSPYVYRLPDAPFDLPNVIGD